MSSGIASVHKILKDETRQKIILLLHQKDSLSYTELMNELKVVSTGKLNYHLKVLNDLVKKNDESKYALTDKGLLASRFLTEFPNADKSRPETRPKWWRRFWIGAFAFIAFLFAVSSIAYLFGYINATTLYQNLITIFLIIGFTYMLQHILNDVISRRMQLAFAKIQYIAGGISAGIGVAYIAVGLILVGISKALGQPFGPGNQLWVVFSSVEYSLFTAVIVTIGAIASYNFGKKRNFRTWHYYPNP
jgi:DNA-binding transcriptional ArsR family regulator